MTDLELVEMATKDMHELAHRLNNLGKQAPSTEIMLNMTGCGTAIATMAMGLAAALRQKS